jgi:hypothetical protein
MKNLFETCCCFVPIMIMVACNSNEKAAIASENQIVGTWHFVADQLLDKNNALIKQDTAVDGYLIYTAEGKMSVQLLWKAARNSLMNDTIMNQAGFSPGLGLGYNQWNLEQTRLMIDTYEAYYGDYSIDLNTNTVSHILSGNLRPEKAGIVYKRIFAVKGDSLLLRSSDSADHWGVVCLKVR